MRALVALRGRQVIDRLVAAIETNASQGEPTLLPTLIIYIALQRYFIAGLTIGAEKG